jgi:hypothetical protein
MRFAPVRPCFAAALSNSSLCSAWERATQDHPSSFPAYPDVHGSVKYFVPTLREFVSGSIMRTAAGLPKKIYSLLKIGMAEPTESFLRASRSLSNHDSRSSNHSNSMGWATGNLNVIGSYNVCLVEAPPVQVPGIEFRRNPWLARQCVFVLETPSSTTQYGSVSLGDTDIYPWKFFPFGARPGSCNRTDSKSAIDNDFSSILELLEEKSAQYQLIQSTEANAALECTSPSIRSRYSVFALPGARWPYTYAETIDGIRRTAVTYGYDQLLQQLLVAFRRFNARRSTMKEVDTVRSYEVFRIPLLAQTMPTHRMPMMPMRRRTT